MNKQFPQPISLADSLRSMGYCVQEGDLPQAARVMAAAFGDDPSIRYLLGGEAMGRDDWRYFLTVLRAVYDRCVLLSTDETVQDLLVLFPPELQTMPAAPFFLPGAAGAGRAACPAVSGDAQGGQHTHLRASRLSHGGYLGHSGLGDDAVRHAARK